MFSETYFCIILTLLETIPTEIAQLILPYLCFDPTSYHVVCAFTPEVVDEVSVCNRKLRLIRSPGNFLFCLETGWAFPTAAAWRATTAALRTEKVRFFRDSAVPKYVTIANSEITLSIENNFRSITGHFTGRHTLKFPIIGARLVDLSDFGVIFVDTHRVIRADASGNFLKISCDSALWRRLSLVPHSNRKFRVESLGGRVFVFDRLSLNVLPVVDCPCDAAAVTSIQSVDQILIRLGRSYKWLLIRPSFIF